MKTVEHYLVSMPMATPGGYYVHSYVIATEHDQVVQVTNRMIDALESTVLPIFLETILDAEGAKRVEDFVAANFPESRQMLKQATDFHFTCFGVPNDSPDADWLLALH